MQREATGGWQVHATVRGTETGFDSFDDLDEPDDIFEADPAQGDDGHNPPHGQSKLFVILAVAILLSGFALLGYPVAVSWYEAWLAEQSITTISDVYDNMGNELRLENAAQARSYNAVLSGREPEIPVEEIWEYDRQLTYHDQPSSMMSYIDIPRISSRLPVFHHTTDEILMAGVGHVDVTALPVGGEGTRCVLSAHSGMQYARMFDDIRLLEKGDTFVLWTLSEPYAYRICDIRVVLPEEAPDCIEPEEGRDLCTLVTCTPYGVNTHRLLVTGERCEYVPAGEPASTRAYVNNRTIPFLIGLGIVFALVILMILIHLRRRKRRVTTRA